MTKENLFIDFEENVISVVKKNEDLKGEGASISMGNFLQSLLNDCSVTDISYTFDYTYGVAVTATSAQMDYRFEYSEHNFAFTLTIALKNTALDRNKLKSKYPDVIANYKNNCVTLGWSAPEPEAKASYMYQQALDVLGFILENKPLMN